VLPEKISIGDTNIGTPSPGRATTQRSNVTVAQAEAYIDYAQQYLDGKLRPFYSCPLRRTKVWEGTIESDISAGTSVGVIVRDSGPFNKGCTARLQNKDQYENVTVASVTDVTTIVLARVVSNYSATDTKISILEYPDPIPITTARLACAMILDRLFSAEQAPDVSTYGKTQRNLARDVVDGILRGEISLFGQEHTGRRFIRGSLFDAYASPAEIQKGEEKE
jgi:hypothetical protein